MIEMTQDALSRLGGPTFYRRILALFAFLALLFAFRHLALLGVAFVVFSHTLGWLATRVSQHLGLPQRKAVGLVLLIFLLLLSGGIFAFIRMGGNYYSHLVEGKPFLERIRELQSDLLHRVPSWLPVHDIKERAPHILTPAMNYARATGQIALQLLVGFILALVYQLDPEPVDKLLLGPEEESFLGTVRRYFDYLADALLITIQLQLLVALVNTVLTLPVLLILRLPNLGAFTAVIFFSSLVPVVGNLISGAVLITASYAYRGIFGAVFFVVTTFILHKIEAYYLNPRLTARHVSLPSLVLIMSLIAFEHVFGLIGLFLSFPSLYVGIKVFQELRSCGVDANPQPG